MKPHGLRPTSLALILSLVTCSPTLLAHFQRPANAGSLAANIDSEDPIALLQQWIATPADQRGDLNEQPFAEMSLSKQQAEQAKQLLWDDHLKQRSKIAEKILQAGEVSDGTHTMKFAAKTFGEKPDGGHSLYLSLHGGGGAPARVNDRQWENQKGLYSPKEGIYVAPRAPTDTWNLWHQAHVDGLFRQIIEAHVVTGQVDPNRVYVMGYSAGGDGVYQLAPRMADSFAAAAMMAGHPNEASPLGLRNIGFTIHMGGNDSAYNRNQVARQWGQRLDELQQKDPGGYAHETVIHEGKGHWMDRQDAVALEFLARFTRNPNPSKVVWYQDDVTRNRFYWLAVDDEQRRAGTTVTAAIESPKSGEDQKIRVDSSDLARVTIHLSDELLDLDKEVTFVSNGKPISRIPIARKIGTLWSTLQQSHDPGLMWSVELDLTIPEVSQPTPTQDDGPK